MDEKQILHRLRDGDAQALEPIIDAYSAYVYAIVKNIIDPPLRPEDCEEVVSDVFYRLWRSAGTVMPGKLKAWLAAAARNRAKDKLRSLHIDIPLEEEQIELEISGPEELAELGELRRLTRRAVEELPEPERSIFQRYYFLYQKTEDIASVMQLNPATVRTKLARGREKLRLILLQGGVSL